MPRIPFGMHPSSWGKKGKDRDIAQANYELQGEERDKKIEEIERFYEKAAATAKKEPWVNVVAMGVNPENVVQGYFELDWNDEFVLLLQDAGITGKNDEEIVNKWFNGVCRTVLIQEGADQDYGLEQQGRSDVEYR